MDRYSCQHTIPPDTQEWAIISKQSLNEVFPNPCSMSESTLYVVTELKPKLNKKSIGQVLMYSWGMMRESAKLQIKGRTIPIEPDAFVQPVIGCAGVKQDYYIDFMQWFADNMVGPIGSGIGPGKINQVYVAGVQSPSPSFQEKELREPVKRNIEDYLDETLGSDIRLQEWLTEPSIEIRERAYTEAPANVHERPDIVGIAKLG